MDKRKYDKDYDKFENIGAYSSTECTGLFSVPPQNEDEYENYNDIYDFGIPKATIKSKKKKHP